MKDLITETQKQTQRIKKLEADLKSISSASGMHYIAKLAGLRPEREDNMRPKRAPCYDYIEDAVCPECGENCNVVPLFNEFDYAGTHCTGGCGGTHYPGDWGSPISDCCEVPIEV